MFFKQGSEDNTAMIKSFGLHGGGRHQDLEELRADLGSS